MNGVELFLLGRALMKIGEEAMPSEGIGDQATSARTVLIVVSDLRAHPETTVGEIATRTGLPQSAVSAAIGRLRTAGAVIAETDPRDRRRTIIREAPEVSERVTRVRDTPIDDALAAALGTDDPQRVRETVAALEELADRLIPQLRK
ncbi:DNA-binding MarR family transcriptional regulator [Nonomuraea thailandensis]|uniref:DNA-binding MarR family transcriptional regulator n=1 Tax=Nonomuraea thailandensis TaxID=1188745 RepID=A0A9X2GW96_9ACTN|nr:MarR family transcriptional regulator [Nonomuraea thailandensis]MCP2361513.1 DNA-binding MarR family transcriptional regulator [Nonomuraea thailandensis]